VGIFLVGGHAVGYQKNWRREGKTARKKESSLLKESTVAVFVTRFIAALLAPSRPAKRRRWLCSVWKTSASPAEKYALQLVTWRISFRKLPKLNQQPTHVIGSLVLRVWLLAIFFVRMTSFGYVYFERTLSLKKRSESQSPPMTRKSLARGAGSRNPCTDRDKILRVSRYHYHDVVMLAYFREYG